MTMIKTIELCYVTLCYVTLCYDTLMLKGVKRLADGNVKRIWISFTSQSVCL